MAKRYVEINEIEFRRVIEDNMGFTEVSISGVTEKVWDHPITGTKYNIRVFSTIQNGKSRKCGQDAIRVTLFDMEKNRPVAVEKKVLRTQSALVNMKERARELWRYVRLGDNICPDCGGLLVPRKGKYGEFYGCSNFPACHHIKK